MFKNIKAPTLTKIILVIICISSLIFLGASALQSYSLKHTIDTRKKELRIYRREGLSNLEKNRLSSEKQLNVLTRYYKEIVQTLSSKPRTRMPKEADPLKFKEELYKAQTKLKQDGSSINFQFPPSLGFAKYEREIPSTSELLIGVKQLDIIQQICGLMVESKVPEVTAIEFEEAKDVMRGSDIAYKELPVRIVLKCNNENLINFLYGLSVSDIPFMISYMNLKTVDERPETKGQLEAILVITAAVFP